MKTKLQKVTTNLVINTITNSVCFVNIKTFEKLTYLIDNCILHHK